MTDADLLAHLVTLEVALMRCAGPLGAAQAEGLLHPAAEEVGRSGRCYDRGQLLAFLSGSDPDDRLGVRLDDAVLHRLGEDLALLRYRSWRDDDATERSSLWQRHGGAWRLRFHQGTAAD